MSRFTPEFAAHLAGSVTTLCHCWLVTRADGERLGFTDHDLPLVFDGTTFRPESGLSGSEARASLGLAADGVEVEGALSALALTEEEIGDGLYDGARMDTFLVNWRTPAQRSLLRTARIGRITLRDGAFVAELQSTLEALDRPKGRYITRICDAELGDGRCRVNLGAPGLTGTGCVAGVGALGIIGATGLGGFAADWFSGGLLSWTSGALAGRTVRVREHRRGAGNATLFLDDQRESSMVPGDTFTIAAGCDKSFSTCRAKFGNALNFRGFPHLPGNDRAYSYVTEGAVFDGAPLVP